MVRTSRKSRGYFSLPRPRGHAPLLLALAAASIPAAAWGSNFIVLNTNDSGNGSLRQEIINADANPGSTITFTASLQSQTITLQSALPQITAATTIDGSNAGGLTISGNNAYRVFFINDAAVGDAGVAIENLTIANGSAIGGNGGLYGGGGGAGMGGGLFVGAGNVSVVNVGFSGSAASGGNGGNGSATADSGGGGGGLGGAGGPGDIGSGPGGGGYIGSGGRGSLIEDDRGGGGGGNPNNGAVGDAGGAGGTVGGGSGGTLGAAGTAGTAGGGGGGGGFAGDGATGGDYGGGGAGGSAGSMGGAGGAGGFGGGAGGGGFNNHGAAGGFGAGGGGDGFGFVASAGGAGGAGGGGSGGASTTSYESGGGGGGGGGGGAALGGAVFVRAGATISFTNTSLDAGALTAGGGGLGGGSGGTAGSDGSTAGSSLYLMGGNTTFNLSGNTTSTIAGSIAESAPSSLTITGAGTLVLSGNNSYSGGTTIANSAIVSFSSIANLGAATGAVTLTGGTLLTSTTLSTPQPMVIDAGINAIDVPPGTTAALTGAISGNGTLNKTDTGTLILTKGGTFGGPLYVNAGTLSLGTALPSSSISVLTGAALQLEPGAQINTSLLTLAAGSTLDITDNTISFNTAVSNSSAVSLVADLRAAYNGGTWTGTSATTPVITSSLAQASQGITTLGYLVIPNGLDIIYTFPGDTDLNGTVNAADLANLSAGIGWDDFNYDGTINADDYALFMFSLAESGGANISTTLPEPSLLLASGFWLLTSSPRRRLRRQAAAATKFRAS